ncbi:unnamed protein product, partial [marine sediment metagenome]
MSGYEGVCFVAGLGTIVEGGTLDVYAEGDLAN